MKKYAILLTAFFAACNSSEEQTSTQRLEYAAKILEYTPAPGQFINEPKSGFTDITTQEAACRYAEGRLAKGDYVSLGGWGGYIVAGFSAPVPAGKDYELYIAGNPLNTSSEPGIVWVMQDENGNGKADDTWFELRGSESENPAVIRDYSISYFRSETDNAAVAWRDNQGNTGTIDLIGEHTQPTYYPAWIANDEMTFTGVCLPNNLEQGVVDGTDSWLAKAFAWGYVDNYSATDMVRGYNRFRIADATTADGQPAHLTQIDFVKIQSGVNAKAPNIGEISTEVCRIACMRTVRN